MKQSWRSGRIRLNPKEMMFLRMRVYTRSGGYCERELNEGGRCNRRAVWDWEEWNRGELHHVVHRSQGGSDTEENCQWWCLICHSDHHNGTVNGKML